MISITVQQADFDLGAEYQQLQTATTDIGGIAVFTGQVRDNPVHPLDFMRLEHYPGMTEQSLQKTAEQAEERWPVIDIRIIHRYGDLKPGDQIVFVGVSSAHRESAFSACEYIMDVLKTSAPFWKKEQFINGDSNWIDAKNSDDERAKRWQK